MGKNIVMIVMSLVVSGLLWAVLHLFVKRLRKIEINFWGAAAVEAGKELEKSRAEAAAAKKKKSTS